MKNVEQQSLAGIVLDRHEVIPVLEKYGLDYCCRGKKTLSEACAEKNISLSSVKEEMQLATEVIKANTAIHRNECRATDLLYPHSSSLLCQEYHTHHH